jgi:uncharacterized membrane protein YgcG
MKQKKKFYSAQRLLAPLRNSRGNLLVQVLVASVISGIVMAGMISMLQYQNKEMRALTEKMASLDLYRSITETISNTCSFQMSQLASPPTFNPSLITASSNPPAIDLGNKLFATASATGPLIAEVGKAASPSSNTLIVKSIQLTGINCAGCANPSAQSSFEATLQINFDEAKMVRAIRPVTSKVILQTSDAGALKSVTACQSGSSGGGGGGSSHSSGGLYGYCSDDNNNFLGAPATRPGGNCACPAGYTMVKTGKSKDEREFSCYKN